MPSITDVYDILFAHFGELHWWPGNSSFEVIIGAILTQQASWTNVEKALDNLKMADMLELEKIGNADVGTLEELIVPSGYFRQKAKRIKGFCRHIQKSWNSDLGSFLSQDKYALRNELLSMHGIGPETADSIILYAADKPVFVIDAYTIRAGNRIGIFNTTDYHEAQAIFEGVLENNAQLFNEFHALWVMLGKNYCKKNRPKCSECPVKSVCAFTRT